jgi:YD repeat-containing protein
MKETSNCAPSARILVIALATFLVGITATPDATADARWNFAKRSAGIRTVANGSSGGDTSAGGGGEAAVDLPAVQVYGIRWVEPSYSFSSFSWGNRNLGLYGTMFSGSGGSKEQETNDKQGSSPCEGETSANPVVLSTGNKVEPELDFASTGEMGLFLQRTYNHHWSATGLFGNHWLSNFDYTVAPSLDGSLLWAQRPDGRRIKFVFNASQNRWNEDKAQPVAYAVKNADGSYVLYNEGHGIERYDAGGYITQLKNEHGVAWNFTYSGKYLQSVTHSSGRSIVFTWNNGQLVSVTDPAGAVFQYSYSANIFGTGRHRLASATLPGTPTTTVSYHYEDSRYPGGLTGKSYNGVRYSTFAYDANARATLSEHAGGVQRYTFSYAVDSTEAVAPPPAPPPPGGFLAGDGDGGWCEYEPGTGRICYEPYALPGTVMSLTEDGTTAEATTSSTTKPRPVVMRVTETNPLQKQTVYHYEDARRVRTEGLASASCPAAAQATQYDANGFKDKVTDFRGAVTDYDYDPHGYLTAITEAVGTAEARISTYGWDPKGRPSRVTVQGDSETLYTYETDGRIKSIAAKNLSSNGTPNQTLTTTYSYTKQANGLLASMTVDGPLVGTSDAITYTYNTTGDLTQVRNSLGHATTYSAYDAMGRPGRVVGPNGDINEFVYDARGRVTQAKMIVGGVAQITGYTYDGAGRIASIQTPDGRTRTKIYDAAGRLLREYEPEVGGTYAQIRYTYNNLSQVTSVITERTTAVIPPAGVPSLTAPALGAQGIYTVAWTGVSAAEFYVLEESANSGAWIQVYSGSAGGLSFSDKATGSYAYRIRACNAAGCAATSNSKTVSVVYKPTTAPVPNAPSQSTSGSYTVSWTTIGGAATYKLEESANGGTWASIQDTAATSRAIAGKTSGTYGYRVSACNAAGCGPVSGAVSVNEIDPPGVPSLSAPAVNETGSYTVNWTSVATATSYRLEESANGGAWTQVQDAAAISKAFSAKSMTLPYGYRVRACNLAGCGAYSAAATVQQIIYGAQYISQSIPTTMTRGQTYSVTVQMKNTGNASWTAGKAYSLGSQNPGDNTTWGMNRVAVPGTVAPGQTATFVFNVTAPGSVNPINFQWRMVRDGYTWFGDIAPNVVVSPTMVFASEIISHDAPTHLFVGDSATVTVKVKNTGNTVWGAPGEGSVYLARNSSVYTMPDRINLVGQVAPGQVATFTYTFYATATSSGVTNRQVGGIMAADLVGWFGPAVPVRNITVENTTGYCPPNEPYCEDPW